VAPPSKVSSVSISQDAYHLRKKRPASLPSETPDGEEGRATTAEQRGRELKKSVSPLKWANQLHDENSGTQGTRSNQVHAVRTPSVPGPTC
jgi:hypothetical protein